MAACPATTWPLVGNWVVSGGFGGAAKLSAGTRANAAASDSAIGRKKCVTAARMTLPRPLERPLPRPLTNSATATQVPASSFQTSR